MASSSFLRFRWGWFSSNIAISNILLKPRFVGLNICRRKYPCQLSRLKHCQTKLSKSAISEGVRHFERQLQVDGDVASNRSMDRWIGEWCSYNFAAESFHTKKLCSRHFSREVEFYWHKQRYRVFVPLFGGLRGNVLGSWMARWKARGRLPIGANWTFLLAITVEALWAFFSSKSLCSKEGWVTFSANFRGKGASPTNEFWHDKTRVPELSYSEKNCRKFQPPE